MSSRPRHTEFTLTVIEICHLACILTHRVSFAMPSSPGRHANEHEAAFLACYPRLIGRARQLADREISAEDLVHDAFVQFTLQRPDLRGIGNLDAYLFVLLRNLHLSRVRRSSALALARRAIVDFESAELGLATADECARIDAFQELADICRFACIRRHASCAASVLILRFFHGYSPFEIARLARCSVKVVDDRLHLARREAKLRRHAAVEPSSAPDLPVTLPSADAADFLAALRDYIFRTSCRPCPSAQLSGGEALSTQELAHLVACRSCLERASQDLCIPPPRDRSPDNAVERGPRSFPQRVADLSVARRARHPAPTSGAWSSAVRGRQERRPAELQVAANGIILGSHRVGSGVTEARLSIRIAEPLGFVEVLDEEGCSLLLLCVDPLPEGAIEQSAEIPLSDRRRLRVVLSFREDWPSLLVVYESPALVWQHVVAPSVMATAVPVTHCPSWPPRDPHPLLALGVRGVRRWCRALLGPFAAAVPALRGSLATLPSPVRACASMVIVVLIVLAAIVTLDRRATPLSAATVLERTASTESRAMRQPQHAVRRRLLIEERMLPARTLVAERRVELWWDAARGRTSIRLYDSHDKLLLDTYAAGYKMPLHSSQAKAAALSLDKVWALEPSAAIFSTLVDTEVVDLAEHDDAYVLSWREEGSDVGLIGVALRVDKAAGRAVEQTLVVRGSDLATREFRLAEISFAMIPPDLVDPKVFELQDTATSRQPEETVARGVASSAVRSAVGSVTSSGATEIEAWLALHALRLHFGPLAGVNRTADGDLTVSVRVSGRERAEALRTALADIASRPGVTLDVRGDASNRLVDSPAGELGPDELSMLPSYSVLHTHFSQTADATVTDRLIGSLAQWADAQSQKMATELASLEYFLDHWPPARVTTLDLDRAARWQTIVRDHIDALGSTASELGGRLQPLVARMNPVSAVLPAPVTIELEPALAELSTSVRRQRDIAVASFQPDGGSREVTMEDVADLLRIYGRIGTLAEGFRGPWSLVTQKPSNRMPSTGPLR